MALNLNDFYFEGFSQRGEQGILEEIIRIIGIKEGFFIEFGGSTGFDLSNTWALALNKSWKGIYLESNKKLFTELQKNIKKLNGVYALNEFVSHQGYNTLDNILDRNALLLPKNGEIDLISIDIDGNDYEILRSIELYLPKIIVVECNPYVNPLLDKLHHLDTPHVQESLYMFNKLLESKGYKILCYTQNIIACKQEYAHLFDVPDNLIDIFMNGFVKSYMMQEDDPKMYERVLRNIQVKYKLDNNWLYNLLRERNLI